MTAKEERAMVLKTLSEISDRMEDLEKNIEMGVSTIKSLQREVNALKRQSKDLLPVISNEPEENRPKKKRENKFNPDDYRRIELPEEFDKIDDSTTLAHNRQSRPAAKKTIVFCEDCRKDVPLSAAEVAGRDLTIPYRCPQARTASGCLNKKRR